MRAGNFHGRRSVRRGPPASCAPMSGRSASAASIACSIPRARADSGRSSARTRVEQRSDRSLSTSPRALVAALRHAATPLRCRARGSAAGQQDHVSIGDQAALRTELRRDASVGARDRGVRRRAGGGDGQPSTRPDRRADRISRARGTVGADRVPGGDIEWWRGGVGTPHAPAPRRGGSSRCHDCDHARCARHAVPRQLRSWQPSAVALPHNNLDPEVGKDPDRRRVRRHWPCARSWTASLPSSLRCSRCVDDETLLVHPASPSASSRTHEPAPRVLIANSLLVPRWATWEEFWRLEAKGLMMYGQMTAGSWITSARRASSRTFETFEAVARKHSVEARRTARRDRRAGGMGGASRSL